MTDENEILKEILAELKEIRTAIHSVEVAIQIFSH